VNLKLLLHGVSGFFTAQGLVDQVPAFFMLPWAMPALSSFCPINLDAERAMGADQHLIAGGAMDGPPWLDIPGFAFGLRHLSPYLEWLPFWTLIFLAGAWPFGRLYEAADVDGASRSEITHVTCR